MTLNTQPTLLSGIRCEMSAPTVPKARPANANAKPPVPPSTNVSPGVD